MLGLAEFPDIGLPLVALVVVSLTSCFYYFNGIKYRMISIVGKKVPPGSLGLPMIGESWSFNKAQLEDRGRAWMEKRVATYGPIFKTSIAGGPTVVMTGRVGNKFIFSAGEDVLKLQQPASIIRINGKRNLFELTGARHKLIKGAIMAFLKPEFLQANVGCMDTLVKTPLIAKAKDNDTILAVPFMKGITFNLTCYLLFGLYDETTREALYQDFSQAIKGIWSLPLKIPGTTYHRATRARTRIEKRMLPILKNRRKQLSEGTISRGDDLMCNLLSMRDENGHPIEDDDVIDIFISLMVASHDTTNISSLMVWKLAKDPEIYNKVLGEQMNILKERGEGTNEELTWTEIQKMKYTWRVAQELMRIIPPVFGNFRRVAKDISFGGYDIPKGWQVFWEVSGTHMDKDIFEHPTKFDPSRFENPSKPIPPYAYIPFGSGPRMCIGNEFARVETLILMHHLVTKFEWSLLCPDEKIIRQPFPYPSKGLPIKLKARRA